MQHSSKKYILVCIGIASFLQWLTYQLLMHGKLGSTAECYVLAQTFVVFMVAPYLAALNVRAKNCLTAATQLLSLSPISFGKHLCIRLVNSLNPIMCWVFFSTGFALPITDIPIAKGVKMLVLLLFYSFSAGAAGMWGATIFEDTIFGAVGAYFLLCLLIGSPFFMMPLERYLNDIQPLIQPMLHLNPMIAVCNIFDGMDIFRTTLLYEQTPITSYDFSYPSWYIISFWQLLIGGCCFLGTWLVGESSKFVSI